MADTLHLLRTNAPRSRSITTSYRTALYSLHPQTTLLPYRYRIALYTDHAQATLSSHRSYATQTSLGTTSTPPPRPHRKVTVFNDDGHVKWGDLSPMEKAARTTQQSFNFGLVLGGIVLTAGVFTLLYTDVFSPQSSTAHFNRAVTRIRSDARMHTLLGPGNDIAAYGEASWNKWRRNRPIAARTETDKFGTERMYMHFNVSGPQGEGVAHLFMIRRQGEGQFGYGYLAVDVYGHERVYLENAEADKTAKKATPGTFLGFKWS